jgi:uncharacterized protein with FMN-binding domain
LARRALAASVGTVAGLAALLWFKTTPLPRRVEVGAPPGTGTSASPGTSDSSPATQPPATGPATTTPSTAAGGTRTVKGTPVENRYGVVQVEVKLQGNHIVDVIPLQMPNDRPRSADISQQAAPLLHDEVLQAQSAQIDIIGGATYTTESYAESLQAALDAARQ